jgi:hypothetical protein
MDIERFNAIFLDKSSYELVEIRPFAPTPSEGDYEVGYITRYFVQRIADESIIFEINDRTYSSCFNNPFFKTVNLDWKISGDASEIKEANKKSLKLASETLPTIELYLPYLLQYSK